MTQTTARRVFKAIGITLACCVFLLVAWIEVAVATKMLADYRTSIVRDTVAAMKEANVR